MSTYARGQGPLSKVTCEPLWGPDWTDIDLHQRIINKTTRVLWINEQIMRLEAERDDHVADVVVVEDELRRSVEDDLRRSEKLPQVCSEDEL